MSYHQLIDTDAWIIEVYASFTHLGLGLYWERVPNEWGLRFALGPFGLAVNHYS